MLYMQSISSYMQHVRLRQIKNMLAFNAAKMRMQKLASPMKKVTWVDDSPEPSASSKAFKYALDTDETQVTGDEFSFGEPSSEKPADAVPSFPEVPSTFVTRREQLELREDRRIAAKEARGRSAGSKSKSKGKSTGSTRASKGKSAGSTGVSKGKSAGSTGVSKTKSGGSTETTKNKSDGSTGVSKGKSKGDGSTEMSKRKRGGSTSKSKGKSDGSTSKSTASKSSSPSPKPKAKSSPKAKCSAKSNAEPVADMAGEADESVTMSVDEDVGVGKKTVRATRSKKLQRLRNMCKSRPELETPADEAGEGEPASSSACPAGSKATRSKKSRRAKASKRSKTSKTGSKREADDEPDPRPAPKAGPKRKAKAAPHVAADAAPKRARRMTLDMEAPVTSQVVAKDEITSIIRNCTQGGPESAHDPNVTLQFPTASPVRLVPYWSKWHCGVKVLSKGNDNVEKWRQPYYISWEFPCMCTKIYVATQIATRPQLVLVCRLYYVI